MPQVSTTTSFTRTNDKELNKETKLYITTSDLSVFDWSAKSEEIISSNPKGVYIKHMISDYYNLVTDFQKWYEQKQKVLLKQELIYISTQEKELKKQQIIFNLRRFFVDGSRNKNDFEKILFRHVSNLYYNKIVSCSKKNRVELIIKSLESINIKTKEFEEQIKELNNYRP